MAASACQTPQYAWKKGLRKAPVWALRSGQIFHVVLLSQV
jgi:hypothetical protein